jgi:imidazolonepropionase
MTLLHHISQLLTLTPAPQRGGDTGTLNIIPDGAVLMRDGLIQEVGTAENLLTRYPNEECLDCGGNAVLPGLVDPHTHLVFAGERANEFDLRLQGKTYMEIMAAGGGIASTVKATRQASPQELLAQARQRAKGIFTHGVTTAEAKSGYGLEWESEKHQLETLLALDAEGPLELAPTFLGAHAIPPEFGQDTDGFTTVVTDHMLPDLHAWWTEKILKPLPFVDVFCERGAFNLAQTEHILTTAKGLGFPLKVHVDEFENLGGASLAARLGAASADHLVKTSPEDIKALAESNTVAVALPCTPFGLADPNYTPARQIIQAGGLLAIASDLNPGTAWCENIQFVIALACRYLRLTPAEAIAAATINAAAAIQREDRIGSITPGKQADLIILTVPDYRQIAYRFGGNLVSTVIKKGIPYPN